MPKREFSLLEQLTNYNPNAGSVDVVKKNGNNLIVALINLMEEIDEHFDPEDSRMIQKKILLSIKNQDPAPFNNKLKKML